ncbi:hypothetical protein Pam3_48 [Pseudanabaena phage Pam3]|nr:hypothetical protein Pam3_48 [Pseudanabaena phage Pam3]
MEYKMTMSRDRVRFTFTDSPAAASPNLRAAVRAFGITSEQASAIFRQAGQIVCRPSQFGRFIIYRVEEGLSCNRIQVLSPHLFTPQEGPAVTDVSLNPNKDC